MHNHSRKLLNQELCQIHGNEKQFFCLQENCMVDLCNLCLIFHREIHEESNNEAIIQKKPEVLEITKQNLQYLLQIYDKEQKKIDQAINQRDQIWQEMFQKVSEKFNDSKKFLISIIDSFVKELEEQLFQNYIYPAKQLALEDLFNPLKQLKFKKEKIDQLMHNLNQKKYVNEIIRYAINKDVEKTQYELEQKIENLINSGGKIQPNYEKIDINFDKEKLSSVYKQLQDFVQVNVNLKELLNENNFKQRSQYDQITSQIDISQIQSQKESMLKKQNSSLKNLLKVESPQKFLPKKQSFKEFTPQKLFKQIKQFSSENLQNQDIVQTKCLDINTINYFEEESLKILHFFESKTKNIHYIDIDQQREIIEKINEKQIFEPIQFQTLELDIDFQIPRHHTSIISPEGYIVLLGGLIAEEKDDINFLNKSYILDWENETLVELTQMIYKKAGASAIYTSFGILVVGGIFEDYQVSKKCELYDIANDEWREVQSLNEPCMTSTLCLIDNDQVLKLGGKSDEENLCKTLEIYNFFDNIWTKISIKDFPFSNLSCCVQINNKKVLVFGGVNSQNKQKSDMVHEIDLRDLNQIKIFRINIDLPQKDSFACQQPIIDNKIVLALQNISEDKINSIKNNDKKIICLSNKGIINLN